MAVMEKSGGSRTGSLSLENGEGVSSQTHLLYGHGGANGSGPGGDGSGVIGSGGGVGGGVGAAGAAGLGGGGISLGHGHDSTLDLHGSSLASLARRTTMRKRSFRNRKVMSCFSLSHNAKPKIKKNHKNKNDTKSP
uniref:Uncharacterized protein n=1 Tax=Anopheles atroparvus TaxID=41427 RepID=A0AAG5CZE6_ANOAO